MPEGAVRPAAAQKLPGGQAKQPSELTRPLVFENVDCGQSVGVEEPVPQYAPAGHACGASEPSGHQPPAVQAAQSAGPAPPVSLRYEPAGHVVVVEAPAVQYAAAGQTLQTARPETLAYAPGAQVTQFAMLAPPLSRPAVPAGHRLTAAAPSPHQPPAGQAKSARLGVTAVPAGQSRPAAHASADSAVDAVPACVQA